MSAHWLFTHDKMLDPTWKPGPGEKYADGPKAHCEATVIRGDRVYFKYLGAPSPAPFTMSRERWRTMEPVEVQCSDCEGWDILVTTDCCEQPRHECRTDLALDGAGAPDVRVCRRRPRLCCEGDGMRCEGCGITVEQWEPAVDVGPCHQDDTHLADVQRLTAPVQQVVPDV